MPNLVRSAKLITKPWTYGFYRLTYDRRLTALLTAPLSAIETKPGSSYGLCELGRDRRVEKAFNMDMNGEARIPAPQSVVWDALNDPEALKQAITGCEELERDGDNAFTARVRTKVGPVSARFGGRVELQDLNPPHSYRIVGEGTGGAAGFAKGGAIVRLEAAGPDATLLKYEVDASVGGKLAQIGSRLIDGAARKMADDFFTKFGAIAVERASAAAPAPASPAAKEPVATPQAQPAALSAPPVQVSAGSLAQTRIESSLIHNSVEPVVAPAPIPAPLPTPAQSAEPPAQQEPQAQASAASSTEARLAEDAAAEASRPTIPPDPNSGIPGLMWVAGIGLLVAILLFVLMD